MSDIEASVECGISLAKLRRNKQRFLKRKMMKVFVATKEGQGIRKNDFSWTTEGELVGYAFECDGETVDGNCGCRRSLSGFDSHKATTTFKVSLLSMTEEEYIAKFLESQRKAGWLTDKTDEEGKKVYVATAKALLRIASRFPANRVLEKRGNSIQTRRMMA
jgi:hypothetical protein